MTINKTLADEYANFVGKGKNWLRNHPDDTYGGLDDTQWRSRGLKADFDPSTGGKPKKTSEPKNFHESWTGKWVMKFLNKKFDISTLTSQEAFDKLHAMMVEDYKISLVEAKEKPLSHHTVLQSVDLTLKWFRRAKDARLDPLSEAVILYGHAVLNALGKTLMTEIFEGETVYTGQGTNAEVDASYKAQQSRIRDLVDQYGGSPLVVDVFARERYLSAHP
ncbi:hypothetical protein [Caballeronia sp. SBC2]|uniref:hypothetical protein n=1 Tax=Caballeronia sp. SBC2 TaxID=2705547 RepID=UPI0013E126AA|nr:hypothetical protein [Caballeronia sp. SBC2]QIE22942.1 hypothetical protein SBC2_09550 [Caballeronia sp. SBC2]